MFVELKIGFTVCERSKDKYVKCGERERVVCTCSHVMQMFQIHCKCEHFMASKMGRGSMYF